MKDKSKLIAIILVIITIFVVVLSYLFKNDDKADEKPINIVINYSDFYTVDSCLYRLVTYISSKDSKNLLLVLSENYKKENNINENNILDLFEQLESDSTFVSRKMYYQELDNNITKYYVYGYVEKNQLTENDSLVNPEKKDMYFVVYLDKKNSVFEIEPYSGDIFKVGDQNG